MQSNPSIRLTGRKFQGYLFVVFFAFAVLIVTIGWSYYQKQRKAIYASTQQKLQAIAKLKSNEIHWWVNERKKDAAVLQTAYPAIATIQQFLRQPNDRVKNMIFLCLREYRSQYGYEAIGLFDKTVKLQLGDGDLETITDKKLLKLYQTVLRDKEIMFTDLHRHRSEGTPHMEIAVPLMLPDANGRATPLGLLVLTVSPNQFLFPLIQQWPTPSATGETLLVRKEGRKVVFLNQLRHVRNVPLEMKLPLTQNDLPATKAVEGVTGIVEGYDYRGIRVLADIRPVPGTQWFIVCKKDMSEIENPLRQQAQLALIAVLSVILTTALVFYFILSREKALHYRRMYAAESEKRKALSALRQQDERMRTYFEKSLVGMAIVSPERHWLQANQKLFDMVEYTFQELHQTSWLDIFHPDDRTINAKHFNDLLAGTTDDYMLDLRLLTKTEKVVYTTLSIRAIRHDDGAVDYCVAQLIDISEQRKAMLDRIQLDKLASLGLMVAGLAHELNNPLMGIINYAQFCRDPATEADRIADSLEKIEHETRRCIGIVESLLTFAHFETFDKDQIAPIEPLALVNQVLDLLSFRIKGKGIAVRVEASPGLQKVEVEAEKLQQIVLNLLTNAIDAVADSERREICLRMDTIDGAFRFSIEDTGGGIDQKIAHKIYDPFFTTKAAGHGTGLGLSTTWSIVKEYGGQISFESNPGTPTVFSITLPVKYHKVSSL